MIEALIQRAKDVIHNSYSKYSKFKVAAALCNSKGEIFSGVNVENKSYGLTICAERSAIFTSISNGSKDIETLVIYTPTEKPTTPCGACRQVIYEFSSTTRILCICDTDEVIDTCISDLLPKNFKMD